MLQTHVPETITPTGLLDYRLQRCMTQKELAGLIHIDRVTLARWEKAVSPIPASLPRRLAALGIPTRHWLVSHAGRRVFRKRLDDPTWAGEFWRTKQKRE